MAWPCGRRAFLKGIAGLLAACVVTGDGEAAQYGKRLLLGNNAGFSPASLFGPGDNGAWFAPNDPSTLFRNAGLTLPARFNGSIRGIKDKSGKNRNAVQINAPEGTIQAGSITAAGSGYTDGTYTNIPLVNGTGTGARGTVTVLGGVVTNVVLLTPGTGYSIGAPLSSASGTMGAGTGFVWSVSAVVGSPRWAIDGNSGKVCTWFHQGFKTLPVAFGGALGTNCTIVYSNGSSVEFLTGQSVGTTYVLAKTFFQFLIINRALTTAETASLTAYFAAFCPKYTPTYTCFADASRPDDSGNGLTLATAKKTLPAAFAVLFAQGNGAALGVIGGLYGGQISSSGVPGLAGKTQGMHVIPGTGIVEMTAGEVPNVGTSSAFDCAATGYVLEIWGNSGFNLHNYGNNGVGCSASGFGRTYDSIISQCSNGLTAHATATLQNERCTVSQCPNGAFAHTGDCVVLSRSNGYYGLKGSVVGIGLAGENDGIFTFSCDDFLPDPLLTALNADWNACYVTSTDGSIGGNTPSASQRQFQSCRFGNVGMSQNAGIGTGALHNTTIADSFLNGFTFQPSNTNLLIHYIRCYGAFSGRPRRTATCVMQWDNCVLTRGGAQSNHGVDGFFFNSPTDVYGSGWVKNCIFVTNAIAIFCISNPAVMQAAFQFLNNLFFNNTPTDYTAGLSGQGVDVTGQNPLIVNSISDEQMDWHVSPGSPSLGAGIGGTDIGLGVFVGV